MKKYFLNKFIVIEAALSMAVSPLCAAGIEAKLPTFYMGVCTHFAQYKGIVQKNLEMITDCGFNSIRDDMFWSNIEITKGKYEYPPVFLQAPESAKKLGVEPLCVLAYGNKNYDNGAYPQSEDAVAGYADFAADAAKTLAPNATLLQVWNEWDGGCGMSKFKGQSTQDGYAKLLKNAYKKIKLANPEAIVIQNSFCTGDNAFEESLKRNAISDCDVLSLHTYNHSQGKLNRTPEAWQKRMIGIGEIIKKYNSGNTKPLFVTEMGFNNQTGSVGYSLNQSANYAARLYLLARTFDWIKGVWWYDFQDDGNDEYEIEDNFGIVRNDMTPKPAFFALKSISHIIKNAKFLERIDAGNENIWILKFSLDSKIILAMWNSTDDTQVRATFETSADSAQPFEGYLAGSAKNRMNWGVKDFASGNRALHDNKVAFTLSEKPFIVESMPSNIKLVDVKIIKFDENLRPAETSLSLPAKAIIAKRKKSDSLPFYIVDDSNIIVESKKSKPCTASYNRDFLEIEIPLPNGEMSKAKNAQELSDVDNWDLAFAVSAPKQSRLFTNFKVGVDYDNNAVIATGNQQFGQSFDSLEAKIKERADGNVLSIRIPASALGLVAFEKTLMLKFAITQTIKNPDGSKKIVKFGKGATGWPLSTEQFKVIYFN